MFNYTQKEGKYFITSDKIKGRFGPFSGIFIKNLFLGDISNINVNEKEYPGYKYSIGLYKNSLFIISIEGIEKIIKINN